MEHMQVKKGQVGRIFLLLVGLLVLIILIASGVMAGEEGMNPAGFLPLTFRPTLPPPTSLALFPYATGVTADATDIASAGDGRLFVTDKDGLIYVILPGGEVLDTPFLDIQDRVRTGNWEEGLLGLVFHPDYAGNGYFYVFYTGYPGNRVYLTRFQVSADPNVADPNSALEILYVGKPSEVHNGGDITFGPDGYLYIPIGDGGPDPLPPGHPLAIVGDPSNYGQRTDDLLGNILRIDIDNSTAIPPECGNIAIYTIPPDNPFVDGAGCDEIWSTGFRNPWRISFDRETGDLYMGDVGEWKFEEVNFEPAGFPGGGNYGWHCYEGTYDYSNSWPQVLEDCSPDTEYIFPANEYEHGEDGDGCSVTGGFVYRGTQFPSLRGHYIFADFCWQRLFLMVNTPAGWERHIVMVEAGNISTFGEAANGEIYAGMHYDDTIYQVVVP